MLVVAALPDGFLKGRVLPFLDRADIFIGGHGFKPFDNRRNRGHICGIADLKNEMDMVGHDDVGVNANRRKGVFDLTYPFFDHYIGLVRKTLQADPSLTIPFNVTEKLCFLVCAYCNEICTACAVIKII